ncbi:hybrid sensor histidine kinase/response regulator [Spartinivicinus poritis]|uniref:histidine kinase n=1 Tax=Spartinivicinus poritis TaxID=2994640 RepID=A0ABT5U4G4_9GAMM|nr:hybrid sensor histidine kinase/response regulator [Spartinivicinus sp. A2-2]MDE1461256.1 response regulator [Spartinivicinus sp. A2-2]
MHRSEVQANRHNMLQYLLAILLWACLPATAEVVINNTNYQIDLANYFEIYEDKQAQLAIDQVKSEGYTHRFAPYRQKFFQFEQSPSAIWLRTAIHNNTATAQSPFITLVGTNLNWIDVYIEQDNQLKKVTSSNQRQTNGPLTSHHRLLIPLHLAPNQTAVVFLRIQPQQPLHFASHLKSPSQALVSSNRNQWLSGLLFGLFSCVAIYNLLAFFHLKERNFLYMFALVSCSLIFQGTWQGVFSQFSTLSVASQSQLSNIALLLGCAFASHLNRRYYQIGIDHPKLDLYFAWLCGLCLLATLFGILFPAWQPTELSLWLTSFIVLNIFGCSLYYLKQGNKYARFMLAAQSPCALAILINIALTLNIIQLAPYKADWLLLSITSLTLFGVSYAFSLQFHLQAKEKLAAAEQLTRRPNNQLNQADFLGKVSHELRGPMNGILGMSELLMDTSLTPKQQDYANTIYHAGNELLNQLNQMLDISRLEQDTLKLEKVDFELPGLVEACVNMFRLTAEQRSIELISYLQPDVPAVINSDPNRLQQILLSLLNHAFKQTNAGEILLAGTAEQSEQGQQLRIVIKDTSEGMSQFERQQLLAKKVTTAELLSSNQPDIAIGIIVAKALIQKMGGTFGIKSEIGIGTTFWFTLPLTPVKQAKQPQQDFDFKGVRVLVVDDNETCRKVLTQQCLSLGMDVTSAQNGKEALALLRTKANLQAHYDLVILDQNMPVMNGLQLSAKIKEDPNISNDVLVIMLTGVSHMPSIVEARNAGVKRILTKPIAHYTLESALKEELAKFQPQSSTMAKDFLTQQELPQNLKVLVVEDNPTSAKVIKGMLAKLSVTPEIAANGNEAVEVFKSKRFQIVFMDCEMPIMDGFEATERIRQWEQQQSLSPTPIIALSAHGIQDQKQRIAAVGMNGQLTKPLELAALHEVLQVWALPTAEPVVES